MSDNKKVSVFRFQMREYEHEGLREMSRAAGITMTQLVRRAVFGEEYELKSERFPNGDFCEDFDEVVRRRIEEMRKGACID